MKVIQINSSCGLGSTGKIVVSISKMLDENGVDNKVYYSGNHKSNFKNAEMINPKYDIRMHQILSRLLGDQGWHSSFYTRRLVKKISDEKPSIIHFHNLHGYYLNLKILFDGISRLNVPVIWTLHDCWAFTGHCTHYTACGCEKWKTECNECPLYKTYPYSLLLDRSNDLFKRKKYLYNKIHLLNITTVSNWLKGEVEKSALLSEREVTVIPNAINIDLFQKGHKLKSINGVDISNKFIILGVANNWGPNKGLQDLIKLSFMIGDDYKIVIVGLSEKQITVLPKSIIGIKRTDSIQDLINIYTTADILFNPSTEETFGMTSLEAMASGTPVIVYNSTACAELVSDAVGVVVKPHDLVAVLKSIEEMKASGIQRYYTPCTDAANKYNEKYIYLKYLDLYKKVITENEHKR